jgi:hypothetical protein
MDLIIPCNCFGFIFASKPERSFSSPFQQNTTTIILATLQQIAMSMTTHGPPCDSTTGIPSLAENLSLENANPTFTLFPKLPPELRLKILKHALPFSLHPVIRKSLAGLSWMITRIRLMSRMSDF